MNRRDFALYGAAFAALQSHNSLAFAQDADNPQPATNEEKSAWLNAVIARESSEYLRMASGVEKRQGVEASGELPDMILMPQDEGVHHAIGRTERPQNLAIDTTKNGYEYSNARNSQLVTKPIVIEGLRNLGAFADKQPVMYYTLNTLRVGDVVVPPLFVTDLTSIPRIFYSALRPDGPYAYAAIAHDYLYWTQTGRKADADTLLKQGMEAFNVSPLVVDTIYVAVSKFGESAWKDNARLKAAGEQRLMKVQPTDPRTTWRDWKSDPTHF